MASHPRETRKSEHDNVASSKGLAISHIGVLGGHTQHNIYPLLVFPGNKLVHIDCKMQPTIQQMNFGVRRGSDPGQSPIFFPT